MPPRGEAALCRDARACARLCVCVLRLDSRTLTPKVWRRRWIFRWTSSSRNVFAGSKNGVLSLIEICWNIYARRRKGPRVCVMSRKGTWCAKARESAMQDLAGFQMAVLSLSLSKGKACAGSELAKANAPKEKPKAVEKKKQEPRAKQQQRAAPKKAGGAGEGRADQCQGILAHSFFAGCVPQPGALQITLSTFPIRRLETRPRCESKTTNANRNMLDVEETF